MAGIGTGLGVGAAVGAGSPVVFREVLDPEQARMASIGVQLVGVGALAITSLSGSAGGGVWGAGLMMAILPSFMNIIVLD